MKRSTFFKVLFVAALVVSAVLLNVQFRVGPDKLHARYGEVRNARFLQDVCRDWDANAHLMEGFAFYKRDFRDTLMDKYEDYYAMRLQITLQNDNDFDILALGLEIPRGNGTDAVHVSRLPEKTVRVPAHTDGSVSLWIPVITESVDNTELVALMRKKFYVKVVYADASSGVTSLNGADPALLKKEWVRK